MTGVSRECIRTFVDDLYAAAIGDMDWQCTLTNLKDMVPGKFATFEIINLESGGYADFHSSAAPDVNQTYLEYYATINPRVAGLAACPELVLMSDNDFLSESEMERDEFYNDFLTPHGLRYHAGVRAIHSQELVGAFSIQRTKRQGHVTDAELRVLEELQPHMRRAAQTYLRFGKMAADAGLFQSLLSNTGRGIIIVDSSGKVGFMNDMAEAICRRDDGFDDKKRKLTIHSRAAQDALARAIRCIRNPSETAPCLEQEYAITRRKGVLPYIAMISCVPPSREKQFDMFRGAVIITIDDPTQTRQLAPKLLSSLFGLSPVEAEVACAVAEGLTVRRISEKRGVSIATIRSQLQSILQKMQLRRQSDLIRLLATLV